MYFLRHNKKKRGYDIHNLFFTTKKPTTLKYCKNVGKCFLECSVNN